MNLPSVVSRCCASVLHHIRRYAVAHAAIAGLGAGIIGTPLVAHHPVPPAPAAFARLSDADCGRGYVRAGGDAVPALVPGYAVLDGDYGDLPLVTVGAGGLLFGSGVDRPSYRQLPGGDVGRGALVAGAPGDGPSVQSVAPSREVLQGDVMQPVPAPSWGLRGFAGALLLFASLL
jgi:hypothetical protein